MLFKEKNKLPLYEGDERVTFENISNYISIVDGKYKFTPPRWIEKLVIVEANIAKVTKEGTFAAATTEVLDHLADMGVNGLWVTPIFDNKGNANAVSHYGNRGPQTFGDDCFKATEHEARKEELRSFIKRAHEKGIYVFIDVVTYGALATSPMYQAYANGTEFEGMDVSDWFTGNPAFSGYRYNWKSKTLQAWFADRMLDLIKEYDFDGFRVDSEPSYLWYDADGDGVADTYADIFTDVRLRAAGYQREADGAYVYPENATGRKLVIFSEINNLREYAYDFEQMGVIHYGDEISIGFQLKPETRKNWFLEEDIVSSVKQGKIADGRRYTEKLKVGENFCNNFQYYSYCLSNHDTHSSFINGQIIPPVYQAILAPFIPIWYYGEECGFVDEEEVWLNSKQINIKALLRSRKNKRFYEKFKRAVWIRRKYPDVFEVFPADIRETNIESVNVTEGVLAYTRFSNERVAIILANPSKQFKTVSIEYAIKNTNTCVLQANDLMNGKKYKAVLADCKLCVDGIRLGSEDVAIIMVSY
ncbi:MAG: hypothetical protein J6B72_02915 [Clostridia bacterium]|nr:hypothetical protein [Clostridia bacterium]